MDKNNVRKWIEKDKLVAVIRGLDKKEGIQLSNACVDGGIKIIEVAYTTPDASEVLATLKKTHHNHVLLGAGTVLNGNDCKEAIHHGASFIVSPGFSEDVADTCEKEGILYIPGCMTPSDMMRAMAYGLPIVKLFPASVLGVAYLQAMKGPFPALEFMATGGINQENIHAWLKAGACSVGLGSAITTYGKHGDYCGMKEAVQGLIDAVKGES